MYRRMLVPLDGSSLAEEVFPYARELAGRLDLGLDFLNVCSPDESRLLPMRRVYVEKMAEMVREHALKIQAATTGGQPPRSIEVRGKVVIGYPAEEILNHIEENNIDVVLMATHGASGVRRWALGSVAHKILHASKVPVLLVRSGLSGQVNYGTWPHRTILVPLDGSELAESAIPHAEILARQRGADKMEIVLLTVCEPIIISQLSYYFAPGYPTPLNWEEYARKELEKARKSCAKYLEKTADGLKSKGLNVRIEVLEGNPAERITQYAGKNPFQLIVMATHGRSGISHLAFGSVAEKVMLSVNVPLLIVTLREKD